MSIVEDEERTLPEAWIEIPVSEIAKLVRGVSYDKSVVRDEPEEGYIPIIRATNIQHERLDLLAELVYVPKGYIKPEQMLEPEDVVICMSSGSKHLVGKTAQLAHEWQGSFGAFCAVARFDKALNRQFAGYFFSSTHYRNQVSDKSSGININNLRQSDIESLLFPVPPLYEQHRIVSAIEQQFSRLDVGVAALQRAKAKLKRYRAAVLKAAVEGKLTETWRAGHPSTEPASLLLERILKERRVKWEADLRAKGKDPAKVKYVEPVAPDVESLPELPEEWCWVTVEQISRFVKYGSSSKTSEDATGIPVLRMGNIQEGSLDLTNLKYLPVNHPEFPNLLLESGDLLFNRTNSPELVGKSAVYHGNPTLCSYASYLISVRMLEGCLADYLCFFLNSSYGKVWVASVVSQQVGQANVNGSKLQALAFPLPPLLEQELIIAEVERNLSVISELEAEIGAILKHAERLRQSILREAFMGRLVPQDPTDEPASVLLERIRNERNNQKNNIEASIKKNRSVKVPESVAIDVVDAEQTELWESVGN